MKVLCTAPGLRPSVANSSERAVLALEVDRAHLGHHQAGDLANDPVEPRLAVRRLGHDLPQPPQDDAQRRL
jgi:hypothetical protein